MPTTLKQIRARLAKKRTSESVGIYRYHMAVYKPISIVHLPVSISVDDTAKILIELCRDNAHQVACFTRDQTPNTANLKPIWQFWDSVSSILKNKK